MFSILLIILFFSLIIWWDLITYEVFAAACIAMSLSLISNLWVNSTAVDVAAPLSVLLFMALAIYFCVRPTITKARANQIAQLRSSQQKGKEEIHTIDYQPKLAERNRESIRAPARQRTPENVKKTIQDLNSAPPHAELGVTREQQDKLNHRNGVIEYAHSEALLEQAKREKEEWRKSIRLEMEERRTKWTKERVIESAKNFRSTRDWAIGEGSAYNAAIKHGWVEESCKHMSSTDTTPS